MNHLFTARRQPAAGGVLLSTRRLASLAALALSASAGAQTDTVSLAYLQGKTPVAPDAVTTLGPDMFGDKINLFNGSFSIEQTDMDVPGNNALPVALVRQHSPGRSSQVRGAFADWDLSTPRIEGTFADPEGWIPYFGSAANRCSGYNMPPAVSRGSRMDSETGYFVQGMDFQPWEYGQGVSLVVPGTGSQEILKRASGNSLWPTGGSAATFPLVTAKNWQIKCLPGLKNAAGEGFIAISPEGVTYTFDWMASRWQTTMRKADAVLSRRDFYLMATKVTDRFGNTVTYTYDSATPLNLLRIDSSDGRAITLSYSGGRVSSASDGTRVWQYQYSSQGDLATVVQPDGSRWQFNLRPLIYLDSQLLGEWANCDSIADVPGGTFVGTMTHPSGATATFTTVFLPHGRTGVQRECTYDPASGWTIGAMWPKSTSNQALIAKRIEGAGMLPMNWTYADGDTNPAGEWAPCSSCPDRKTVSVREPDGSVTRHTFGIRWRVNEGQLLKTEEGWDGSSALRTTTYRYRDFSNTTSDRWGDSVYFASDWLSTRNRPQDLRVTNQQGTDFSWRVEESPSGFDGLLRPSIVTTSSTSNAFGVVRDSRRDRTVYSDNATLWVLGQVLSVTNLDTGLVSEQHEYEPATALRSKSYSFGYPKATFTYWPDGTFKGSLKTRTDAAGKTTTFDSFFRGKPRVVVFPDQTSASREVLNLGEVLWMTNEAAATHRFEFDAMRRVSKIIYPSGDPVAPFPTSIAFEQIWGSEYGLEAGHWRQTLSTGNLLVTRYFDAMWRLRLERRYDTTNPAGTMSFVETRYDAAGRKAFESYPVASFGAVSQRVFYVAGQDNGELATPGKWTEYDALGRPYREIASSELGPLFSYHSYLVEFRHKVTNPRGAETTYFYQAFDHPSQDIVRMIQLPDASIVYMPRDLFGKPTLVQRGSGSTQWVVRRYVYDIYQRLCKTIEPESGSTVQTYDLAENIDWRASGQSLISPTDCEQLPVSEGAKTRFTYDARDRLRTTSYGDGSPGIARTYTQDGLLETLTSGGTRWTYRYYNTRKLKSELFSWWPGAGADEGWLFYWGQDGHRNTSGLTDPWGLMDYAPDALGRPTQVSGYATNISYNPNGSVSGYRLNNGIVHAMTPNLRGLPQDLRDIGVTWDVYSYDGQGNVTSIEDKQPSDLLPGNATRSLGYDLLDRLTSANGPWGTGGFTYDTVDNLRSSTIGSRTLNYNYADSSNRLTSISGSQNLALAYDANGNVTQRGSQGFVFDIANRMSSAPGKVTASVHDGHGRRALKYTVDGTRFVSAYTQDGKLRFSQRTNEGHTRHVYLGGKLISETTEPATTYVHTDTLGSPVARTNSIGALISRTRYEPYGATAGGTNPPGIGFTGHVNEVDTGLVYMQQRYYDPIAGRFLSVDPVTTDASTGRMFNRYNYAYNNPYKFVDPDGRQGVGPTNLFPNFSPMQYLKDLASETAKFVGLASLGAGGAVVKGVEGAAAIARTTEAATSAVQAVKLEKALASEAQTAKILAGEGEAIAGAGTKTTFRDAGRVASEHGGQAKDWSKVSGGNHVAKDGTKVETHAVENKATGQIQELKTKLKDEGAK